jgi:hypothetical protein
MFAIYHGVKNTRKFLHVANLVTSSFAMAISHSIQGIILVIFGFFSITFILLNRKSSKLRTLFYFFSCASFILFILGFLQKGPFSTVLYQRSISIRGDYWRAGIRMIRENPVLGVGLDSYGDYYRMYRDSQAISRNGLESFSNSAHNIYIDLFATGGFSLFACYCLLNILVIRIIMIGILVYKCRANQLNTLSSIWIAFQIQNFVSINNSALAIWGWIAGGFILGYSHDSNSNINSKRSTRSNSRELLRASLVLLCVSPSIILLHSQSRVAQAISSNKFGNMVETLSAFPRDAELMGSVAQALLKLDQQNLAITLAERATHENKQATKAWAVILRADKTTSLEKLKAKKKLQKIDPLGLS